MTAKSSKGFPKQVVAQSPKPNIMYHYGNPSNPGLKHTEGKLRWSLLPWRELEEVVKAAEDGVKKYAVDDWKTVSPEHRSQWWDAAMRHLVAWRNGEVRTADSKLHHLAHAICCLLFLMWHDLQEGK